MLNLNLTIMGYFEQISASCEELTNVAQTYLDGLPFMGTDDIKAKIWAWAWDNAPKDQNGNIDWNAEWCMPLEIIDSGIPYANTKTDGSLHYSLGWSIVAQEANLRSLLEFIEGRQVEWTKFQCLAPLPTC